MKVFVDTWAWIALACRRDQYHAAAAAQHQLFRQQRCRYVTSDYVLSELITHLYTELPAGQAQQFVATVLSAVSSGEYELLHVSPLQFARAWDLRQRYHDKPDFSFVDFTSMILTQDSGISDVFTGDAHFRNVSLGFRLLP